MKISNRATTCRRGLPFAPSDHEAKRLYGFVIDMPVASGWDTLAGYQDLSCRYLNFSGAAIFRDDRDAQIVARLGRLLSLGRQIVARIGPWTDPRPPLTPGHVRLSFLCPSGLHFGQGPVDALAADPVAGSFLSAGAALLQDLTSNAAQQ